MRKFSMFMAGILLMSLSGCDTPQAAKDQIMNKHAEFYVFVMRMNDPDPAKRPTQAQMQLMIETAAKDVESLDRIVNGWKPNDAMKSLNFDGTVSKEIVDKYTKKNEKNGKK